MDRAETQAFGIAPPGFRLPPGTGVGPVSLQVSDLDRSVAFYEKVLGLRLRTREGDHAALGPDDESPALVHLRARPGIRPVPPRGAFGLYHFAILLPDRPTLGRFIGHVRTVSGQVGMADHAVSESIYLTDPDGLGIEVYADRPRATWRVNADRQMFMTIDPLNIPSLLEAGGGEPWTGAPAGTVMGHVHLHVGDLDEAAAFYHAALGFDKVVWRYPGALFLAADGYHHHLGTNTWSPGPRATDDQARLLSWDLVLPDRGQAEQAVASLAASGYPAIEDQSGWAVIDPWGIPVRLVVRTRAA